MHHGELDAGGKCLLQAWQPGENALHRLDDIHARLALNIDDDGRHALVPGCHFVALESVDDIRDVAQ